MRATGRLDAVASKASHAPALIGRPTNTGQIPDSPASFLESWRGLFQPQSPAEHQRVASELLSVPNASFLFQTRRFEFRVGLRRARSSGRDYCPNRGHQACQVTARDETAPSRQTLFHFGNRSVRRRRLRDPARRRRVKRKNRRSKVEGTQLGRRRLEDTDADKVAAIVVARAKGTGLRRIARELGVGVGTVLRVTGAGA